MGVKVAKERRVYDKVVPYTYWQSSLRLAARLLYVVNCDEAFELCELLVKYQVMSPAVEVRNYTR